ncbi:MAG: hypothetical protein WD448_06870 [Woeseia sp.]
MNGLAPAIVLSHGPGGLGTVRSLARRGVAVSAIAWDADDVVLHSRHAARTFALEGDDDAEKEQHLLTLLRSLPEREAVILTTSDLLVAFLSRHQQELLQKFRFRLPPEHVLDALNDKRKETRLVQSLGFPIPKTRQQLPEDADALAQQLRLPIIFKPHHYSVQSQFPLKNVVVRNDRELKDFYREWRAALPVLLAQEVIPGPDSASWICSCTYDQHHRLLDCGIKQKLRALPAHFGGSTFAVSCHNGLILALAEKLGRRLEYTGHAGIEFRWDERDGEFKYIELNPRMPANVGFDEACGLATVWNSYLVSLQGTSSSPIRRQRDGVLYLDLKGDMRSARKDGASRPRILLNLARLLLFRRTNGPWFAWDDPRPGMVVAWRFLLQAFRSLQGRRPSLSADKRGA